ncbi:MAG: hydroxyacid dehydrogenase [Clostridia bacterium]|nr:hydroxyacid dehydrogenase [Clostridia bacterium]
MKKSIILTEQRNSATRVYDSELRSEIASLTEFLGDFTKEEYISSGIRDVEVIFSTWGMEHYTSEEIKRYFPRLEAVYYGAGSVQQFAREFLECGIRVHSSWAANAVPVAEYTVAQIILANKGFFGSSYRYKKEGHGRAWDHFQSFKGNYNAKIGIIGAGMIGKMVIERLKDYKLDVLVFDPFLSEEYIREHGVHMASLDEIFETCDVISNHLANNDDTAGMLCGKYFDKMLPNAVFINTGRGRQVVESDLVRALKDCPDRVAILDVTWPEPVPKGHEFYDMDNVILTPHIAGSMGLEVVRMGKYMIDEFKRYEAGEKCLYSVSLEMLKTMA